METFTITGKNLEIVLKKIEKQYGSAAKVISKKQIFLKQPFRKSLTKAIEITGVVDPDGTYQGEGESVEDLNRVVESDALEAEEEIPISPITIHRTQSVQTLPVYSTASTQPAEEQEVAVLPNSEDLLQYHLGLGKNRVASSYGVSEAFESAEVSVPVYTNRDQIKQEEEFLPTQQMVEDATMRMQAIESLIEANRGEQPNAQDSQNSQNLQEHKLEESPEEKRFIDTEIALDRPAQEEGYAGLEAQIPASLQPKGGFRAHQTTEHAQEKQEHEPKDFAEAIQASWNMKRLPEEQHDFASLEDLLLSQQQAAVTEEAPAVQPAVETQPVIEAPSQPVVETQPVVEAPTQLVVETQPVVESQPVTEAPQQTIVETQPSVEAPRQTSSHDLVLAGLVREIESLRKQLELKTSPRGAILTNISLKKIRELLHENGFSHYATQELLDRISLELSPMDIKDYETLQAIVLQWISEMLPLRKAHPGVIYPVVVVVGEPGSGKTSLVAKLAAEYGIRGFGSLPKLTRIASLDTRKVGAKEEIERYGNLMGLLVDVLSSVEEFDRLIENSPDYGLILLDTPNSFSYTKGWLHDITKRLQELSVPVEIILTISATTKCEDMGDMLTKYAGLGYTSIAITKLDQTQTVGNLFSTLKNFDKPVRFITDGARIPGHLQIAEIDTLMRKLKNFTIPYDESEALATAAQYRKPLRGVSFSEKPKKKGGYQPTLDFMEPQD